MCAEGLRTAGSVATFALNHPFRVITASCVDGYRREAMATQWDYKQEQSPSSDELTQYFNDESDMGGTS